MVFYGFTIVMKARQRKATTQALKEIALAVYNGGGLIRKLSNEGVMRPYNRRRDTTNEIVTYSRFVNLQVDMSEEECNKFEKMLREHPDVYISLKLHSLERPPGLKGSTDYFPLDTFVRQEEEINWPPQASADLYEQLDMNWKEFSRTRWSNFLRN